MASVTISVEPVILPGGRSFNVPLTGGKKKNFFGDVSITVGFDSSKTTFQETANKVLECLELPDTPDITCCDFTIEIEKGSRTRLSYSGEYYTIIVDYHTTHIGEVVVCAANRFVKDSVAYYTVGVRHADRLMRQQKETLCYMHGNLSTSELTEGFITSQGRFVDREEGLAIVKSSGQRFLVDRNGHNRELFSEGLY